MRAFGDWRSWKWWRNSVISCVLAWVVYLAGTQVLAWYLVRDYAKAFPEVAVMPTVLPDTSLADLKNGKMVEVFGYTVTLPWSKISKRLDLKGACILQLDGGGRMLFFDPAKSSELKQLQEDGSGWPTLKNILGPSELSAPYNLFKAEMDSSPAHLTFWHSRRTDARELFLLTLKGGFARTGTTALYPVGGGELRGYEAVQSKGGGVGLKLFDAAGNEIELVLVAPKSASGDTLTQAQINAVIASIKTRPKTD